MIHRKRYTIIEPDEGEVAWIVRTGWLVYDANERPYEATSEMGIDTDEELLEWIRKVVLMGEDEGGPPPR